MIVYLLKEKIRFVVVAPRIIERSEIYPKHIIQLRTFPLFQTDLKKSSYYFKIQAAFEHSNFVHFIDKCTKEKECKL